MTHEEQGGRVYAITYRDDEGVPHDRFVAQIRADAVREILGEDRP